MRSKWWILALVALVGLFVYSRLDKSASFETSLLEGDPKVTVSPSDESNWDTEIGLKSVAIKPGRLSLEFKPKKACSGGDLDAIKVELEGNQDKNLLLSVESMDRVAFPAKTAQVSLDALTRGFHQRFDLPADAKPYQVGIFLCRDRKGEKSCGGKPFVDINKLFQRVALRKSPYRIAHSKEPVVQDEDVIYFYQFAVIEGGQAKIFQDFDISPLAYRKLGLYLNSRAGEEGSGAENTLEQVESLTGTLKSLPLQSRGEDLVAELPYFDASACAEKMDSAQLPQSPFKMAAPTRMK